MSIHMKARIKNEFRIINYCTETKLPQSLFVDESGRINGVWIMGNNYRRATADLYGSYPHGYLKRIGVLFKEECAVPEAVLHLFAGGIRPFDGVVPGCTLDMRPETSPTFLGNAEVLLQKKELVSRFRMVLADPPYSVEDAEHYKATMVKRNVIMRLLGQGLRRGALVVWLDQVLPMYRKTDFDIIAVIGMMKSTNHRFRVITVFEKK